MRDARIGRHRLEPLPQHGDEGTRSRRSPISLLGVSWLVALAVFAGCGAPEPALRLPNRVPLTPTFTPFPFAAQAYYEQGMVRQQQGDLDGALEAYNWAQQRSPDFAPAYVARGTVHLAQGELGQALIEANNAIEIDPECGDAYALRGEITRLQGRNRVSLAAYDSAIEMDPALAPETFRGRWLAAVGLAHGSELQRLSWEYDSAGYDHGPAEYYAGWALVERDVPRAAVRLLVDEISTSLDSAAILWFTLGHAYMRSGAWPEAVTSFEAVRELVLAGDNSLNYHSDSPIIELSDGLARAYLGAGRCADAEMMLNYTIEIGAPASRYTSLLQEARICQTPTPTASPYPTTTPTRP